VTLGSNVHFMPKAPIDGFVISTILATFDACGVELCRLLAIDQAAEASVDRTAPKPASIAHNESHVETFVIAATEVGA
jgi:hypothetical protein